MMSVSEKIGVALYALLCSAIFGHCLHIVDILLGKYNPLRVIEAFLAEVLTSRKPKSQVKPGFLGNLKILLNIILHFQFVWQCLHIVEAALNDNGGFLRALAIGLLLWVVTKATAESDDDDDDENEPEEDDGKPMLLIEFVMKGFCLAGFILWGACWIYLYHQYEHKRTFVQVSIAYINVLFLLLIANEDSIRKWRRDDAPRTPGIFAGWVPELPKPETTTEQPEPTEDVDLTEPPKTGSKLFPDKPTPKQVQGPRPGSVRAAVVEVAQIEGEYWRQEKELENERRAQERQQARLRRKAARDQLSRQELPSPSGQMADEARQHHQHLTPNHQDQTPTNISRQHESQTAPDAHQIASTSTERTRQLEEAAPIDTGNSAVGAAGLDFGPFPTEEHRRWAAFQGLRMLWADLCRISSKRPPYMWTEEERAEHQQLAAAAAKANEPEAHQEVVEPPQEASDQKEAPTEPVVINDLYDWWRHHYGVFAIPHRWHERYQELLELKQQHEAGAASNTADNSAGAGSEASASAPLTSNAAPIQDATQPQIEPLNQAPTQAPTQAPAAPTQAPSALDGFGFSDLFSTPLATSIASGSTTAGISPPPLSFIPDRTARPMSSQPTVAAHTTSQAASASTQITPAPTPAPIPTQAPIVPPAAPSPAPIQGPSQTPSPLNGFSFDDLFSTPLATSMANGNSTAAIPPPPFIPDYGA
ncbi:hypothetical protein HDU96_009451, partial [Phlyctochytrium bullatum]